MVTFREQTDDWPTGQKAGGNTSKHPLNSSMKTPESAKKLYERIRNSPSRTTDKERTAYDFHRLVDFTWSLKVAMELFLEKDSHLGDMVNHDLYIAVMVCSAQISRDFDSQKELDIFKRCWTLFAELVEITHARGQELSNDIVMSLVRIMFIAALAFDTPKYCNIENMLTDPGSRRLPGAFLGSAGDIAFARLLSGGLKGCYNSRNDMLLDIERILVLTLTPYSQSSL